MADITLNVAFKINQASYQSVLDSLNAIAEQMQNTVSKSLNIQYNVDTGAFDKINTSLKLLQEIASSCSMSLEKLTQGITVVDSSGIANATTQMQNYADVINSASAGAKNFTSSTTQAQTALNGIARSLGSNNYSKLSEAFTDLQNSTNLKVSTASIDQLSKAFSDADIEISQATASIKDLYTWEEILDEAGESTGAYSGKITQMVNVTAKGVTETGELANATATLNASTGLLSNTQIKITDNMKQENQLTEEQAQKIAELKAQYSTLSITLNSATTDAKSLFKELGGNNATGVDASNINTLFAQMDKLKLVSDQLAKAEQEAAHATGQSADESATKVEELSARVGVVRDELVQLTNQIREQSELISKAESVEATLNLGLGENDEHYLASLKAMVDDYKESIKNLNAAWNLMSEAKTPTAVADGAELIRETLTAYNQCEDALRSLTEETEKYNQESQEVFNVEKTKASNEMSAEYTALADSFSKISARYKDLATQLREGIGMDDQTQLDALIAEYKQYEIAITEVKDALKLFDDAHDWNSLDIAVESTYDAIQSFDEMGKAMYDTINTTQEYIDSQKEAAEATKQVEVQTRENSELGKSTASTYNELTACINKNKDASTSSNEAIRDSYNAMKTSAETLSKLRAQYIQTGEGADDLKQAEDRARTSMETFTTTMRTQGSMLGNLIKQFSQFVSVQRMISYVVRAMRDLINNSIEVNDAMTQLRIVTDETEAAYQEFGDTIGKVAQEIGASITDMVDSVTTYARLGYNLEEATDLAEYTAMLQNVGDIDVEDAQAAVTSMVKAFSIDAADIETVMDELVSVGNNYPISVDQISEGMMNASSALAAAGNSLEQSIALLTSANTTVQDASKSSTGLRTIAARLRNTTTELDELGKTICLAI